MHRTECLFLKCKGSAFLFVVGGCCYHRPPAYSPDPVQAVCKRRAQGLLCGKPWQGEGCAGWAHPRLVVAEDLVGGLAAKWGVTLRTLGALTGAQLAGCQYRHPLAGRTSPVLVGGEYITTESGTGLVHTAPGHGQEDYQVGAAGRLVQACLSCMVSLAWHCSGSAGVVRFMHCHTWRVICAAYMLVSISVFCNCDVSDTWFMRHVTVMAALEGCHG